jgi:hypothetical protein
MGMFFMPPSAPCPRKAALTMRRPSTRPRWTMLRLSKVACCIPWSPICKSASSFEIITDLKAIFAPQARAERYEAFELFFSSRMDEHSSVSEHIVKISGYVQCFNALECQILDELPIDRVLQSLPPSYKGFILNYNMQGMSNSLSELFAMLKTAEVEIKKEHNVLLVKKTTDFKKSGKSTKGTKGKKLQRDGKRVASPPKAPRAKPKVKCFYSKGGGHWKRNCPKYLEDKKVGKVVARDKGIYDIHVIDIYITSACSNTWVFDTGSVAHICNSHQDLRSKRRLERNKVTMWVGNEQGVDIIAVSTLHLQLPSGFILVLNKCYYILALSMNIVSGSQLS